MNVEIRRAGPADVDEIAAAHLDSIRSIGTRYYPSEIVNDWGARVKGDLYASAMARGEVFFIAAGASSIHLDASLAAVEFYKANGFEEVARGEHRLWSGRPMVCVFMRKMLAAAGERR